MRFLFLIEPSYFGTNGVAVAYRNLVHVLTNTMGHEVMVFSTDDIPFITKEKIIQTPGIRLFPKCYPSLKFILPSVPSLKKALDFCPNIIHVSQPGIATWYALFLKHCIQIFHSSYGPVLLSGCSHTDITGITDLYQYDYLNWFLKYYFRIEKWCVDLPISVNKLEQGVRIWNLGCNKKIFYPTPDTPKDSKLVVCACRLAREKNVEFLCKVGSFLRNFLITIEIYGEGPLRSHLEQIKPHNIRLMGSVSQEQLADRYRKASLVISPGGNEMNPLNMMEALCCGTRVLFRNSGGNNSLYESMPDSLRLTDAVIPYSPNEDSWEVAKKIVQTLAYCYDQKPYMSLLTIAMIQQWIPDWKQSSEEFASIHKEYLDYLRSSGKH